MAADSQISPRWQTTVRFGSTDQDWLFTNPSPTGEYFDPFGFGGNYLGQTVTLEGADGRTVSGQAILDYGGTYPQAYPGRTTRRSLFGQTTFQATPNFAVSGRRALRARGRTTSDPDADPSATRNNGGGFVEGRVTLASRVYVSAGIGVEHNEVFETAFTPRLVGGRLSAQSIDRAGG